MDLEEWELLPDEGFLEIHDDGGNQIYTRKHLKGSCSVFQMDYFISPPRKSSPELLREMEEHHIVPNQVVTVPVDSGQTILKAQDHELVKKEATAIVPLPGCVQIKSFETGTPAAADQEPASQVFFKKMKETEFVDMKLSSPKSSRGIMAQIEGAGTFQLEEKGGDCKQAKADLEAEIKKNDVELDVDHEPVEGGLNIWNWSLTGIGAICSFGVATAVTVCFIVFRSRVKSNKHPQQSQECRVSVYTKDDKGMKRQVIQHHASNLNEAISAARGAAISRAHIRFGGYYDAAAAAAAR